jgi:hypothetical protein
LKKGTKQHADGWDASRGFGVTFNDVTKDTAFYTTTSRFVACLGAFPQERQQLWLPKDDLRDSSSLASPPLVLLRDIHSKLLTQYDCTEVCVLSPSQVNAGTSARLNSQDGVSQEQETTSLSLPQLNRLIEASFVRDENSDSNADATAIPSHHRVTATLPGSQTHVYGLAPGGTIKLALTTEGGGYR